MSETISQSSSAVSPSAAPSHAASELVTEQGKTTIADAVVAKIAGIAASDVSGVHGLGGTAGRAMGAIRDRIPGARTNYAQGVTVEVGERQAAVDLQLIADYGVSITDLASSIRRNVIGAIERMTGLEVSEVNIEVQDVYVDESSDEDESDEPSHNRVQ